MAWAQASPLVTHTRHVDIWYGTLSYSDGSTAADEFATTDHITGNASGQIWNDPNINLSGRPGMAAAIPPWETAQTDIDWVLAAAENLPAEQNLRNALSQDCALGALGFAAPISRGTVTYNLVNWATSDPLTDHAGNAEVSYFELNAICTAAGVQQDAYLAGTGTQTQTTLPRTPTTLPSTGAPALILFLSVSALGVGALLARSRRRKASG